MKIGENSKKINYAMKHKMRLSLLLSGFVNKEKIEGVGHLLLMQTNQLTVKNLNIFEQSQR